MGLFGFFGNKEDRITRLVDEMIIDYKNIRPALIRDGHLLVAIRNVDERIKGLEGQKRNAAKIADPKARIARLNQIIAEEKPLLSSARRIAEELEVVSARMAAYAKKEKHEAQKVRKVA